MQQKRALKSGTKESQFWHVKIAVRVEWKREEAEERKQEGEGRDNDQMTALCGTVLAPSQC